MSLLLKWFSRGSAKFLPCNWPLINIYRVTRGKDALLLMGAFPCMASANSHLKAVIWATLLAGTSAQSSRPRNGSTTVCLQGAVHNYKVRRTRCVSEGSGAILEYLVVCTIKCCVTKSEIKDM